MRVLVFGHTIVPSIVGALSDALDFHGINHWVVSKKSAHETTLLIHEDRTVRELTDFRDSDLWIGIMHGCPVRPRRYIAYNTESLISRRGPKIISLLESAQEVFDFSPNNIKVLNSRNINAALLPIAYSVSYEKQYRDSTQSCEKDIDVLYYGVSTPRRAAIIKKLRSAGLSVHWLGEQGDHDYGHLRDQLIARARIVVSMCKEEPAIYNTNDFSRISYLVANKAFIVSEAISGDDIEQTWKEIIPIVSYNEIVDRCVHYIAEPRERESIIAAAYEFAVNHFNFRDLLPIEAIHRHVTGI